jgi:hypothetical protein
LAVIEGALRWFGVGFSTELLVSCTVKSRPAACYNLFFPAPFFPPGMIKTPQAYAIPTDKPQGTFRIFVLGESAALSAANRRHDELLAHSPRFWLWLSYGVCCRP